jgi:polynucleotide 5'-hydroxyl-kinase GRC3/NOL9
MYVLHGVGSTNTFTQITESEADALARPLSPEANPEDWLRAVEDCATEPSIVVTIGATSTGKSTFVRRLLNRYLTGQGKSARSVPAVCYLDLDPAKPEYTPHGQISLSVIRSLNLGPNFMHPSTQVSPLDAKANEIIRAHSMPANLANYQQHYRACAEDLFLAYKNLQAQDPLVPLVVNTFGSVYASDFDLLIALISRFKPHHAVHLGDIRAIDTEGAARLHSLQTLVSQYRGTFHEIAAQLPVPLPQRTDAELRSMHMQSYFHRLKTIESSSSTTTWSHVPISSLVPWEFCYEETEERMQDFVGFAMYSEPTEPASLLPSLNGSIIQIVESTSSAIPTPYVSLSRTKGYHIPYFPRSERIGMVEPLDPKTSKVMCTALVRGFDLDRRVVQVLVPKTHENSLYNLSPERTVFVGGCCDPPEWAYIEDMYVAENVVGSKDSAFDNSRCTPWVDERAQLDNMGYLNTVRRVRKFQT